MSEGPTSAHIDIGKVNAALAEATKAAKAKAARIRQRNKRLRAAALMPIDTRAKLRARDDEFRAIASEFEGEYEFVGLGRKAKRESVRLKVAEWLNRKAKGKVRIAKRKAARQGLHSRGLRNRSDASRARRAARMAAAVERKTARSVVI